MTTIYLFFFFSSRRRHTRFSRDWSSDVCSSDLPRSPCRTASYGCLMMRRLFRHRDARLLLAGESFSMFGDRAMLLVLGIWAKTLTGSSAAAGMVFFVLGLPALAGPLAGLVVDRVRRRTLMIVVDLFMAA